MAELLEQVQKLSVGDIIATHRDLYLRNVSSCELSADADVPEPERREGEVVKFDRWASLETQAVAGQDSCGVSAMHTRPSLCTGEAGCQQVGTQIECLFVLHQHAVSVSIGAVPLQFRQVKSSWPACGADSVHCVPSCLCLNGGLTWDVRVQQAICWACHGSKQNRLRRNRREPRRQENPEHVICVHGRGWTGHTCRWPPQCGP